jgi:hypothetical protein
MKVPIRAKALIGLVCLAGCASQTENGDFRLALNSNGVQAVTVYHVTRNVTTRVDVTPESLESDYDSRLELRGSAFQNSISELIGHWRARHARKTFLLPKYELE